MAMLIVMFGAGESGGWCVCTGIPEMLFTPNNFRDSHLCILYVRLLPDVFRTFLSIAGPQLCTSRPFPNYLL